MWRILVGMISILYCLCSTYLNTGTYVEYSQYPMYVGSGKSDMICHHCKSDNQMSMPHTINQCHRHSTHLCIYICLSPHLGYDTCCYHKMNMYLHSGISGTNDHTIGIHSQQTRGLLLCHHSIPIGIYKTTTTIYADGWIRNIGCIPGSLCIICTGDDTLSIIWQYMCRSRRSCMHIKMMN